MLKRALRWLLVVAMFLAGANHFVSADFYVQIMPPWLPWHLPLVWISGVAEMALAILVVPERTRRFAGWGLIALLLAVFPANLHMALNDVLIDGAPAGPRWAMWLRLPFQALFIAWAWWVTLTPDRAPAEHD